MNINQEVSHRDLIYCFAAVAMLVLFLFLVYDTDIKYISSIKDYEHGTFISLLILGEVMILIHKFFLKK